MSDANGMPTAVIPPLGELAARRATIEDRQAYLGRILADLQCDAAVLLLPAHVAWFTAGLNVRGLLADTERPGIYTNGKQRWLVCSHVDTQRLFDEELDGLGFQLKEWPWAGGRAALLGDLLAQKRVAVDRPYPNMPLLTEKLRTELRRLSGCDVPAAQALGGQLVHALEATARTCKRGDSEEEIAGQVAHRLYHRGVEVVSVSVTAGDRNHRYRRAGFTKESCDAVATIQATAARGGLHLTASRSVAFGPVPEDFRRDYDAACMVAGVYLSLSHPGQTVSAASESARFVLANSEYEFDGLESVPGYGTGYFAAEELRRVGADDPFISAQTIVWQARVGQAALLDTVRVTAAGPTMLTPSDPNVWPCKRLKLKDQAFLVPDVLARN